MGLYINKGIALFLCVEILIYIVISNIRKTKRYVKLLINKKIFIIFLIAQITSGIIVIQKENKFNTAYDNVKELDTIVRVETTGIQKENSTEYTIKILKCNKYTKIEKTKLKMSCPKNEKFEIGDILQIQGEYEQINSYKNKGVFNYEKYLKKDNIYGKIRVSKFTIKKKSKSRIRVSEKIKEKFKNNFDVQTANYFITIILGDKSELDKQIKENFQNGGISHLLAISGMHINCIILIITYVINKTINSYKIRKLITIGILIMYGSIIEFSPSATRAIIMAIMHLTSLNLLEKDNFLVNISISSFIILIISPYYLVDTGFLLSFTATISIVYVYKKLRREVSKNKIIQMIANSLILTISANILIAPIVICLFKKVSLSMIVMGIIISPFIFVIEIIGILIIIIPSYILKFLKVPIELFISIFDFLSSINFLTIYFKVPNIIQIILYYTIIIKFLFKPKRKIINEILTYVIVISIISQLVQSSYSMLFRKFEINLIDVGQGDSILIVTPKNKKILIDGGGNENYDIGANVLIPYLLNKRIKQIDYLIISHFDTDHVGGTLRVLEKLKVKQVIISQQKEDSSNFQKFLEITKKRNIKITVVKAGDIIQIEKNIYIEVLWPTKKLEISTNPLNNNSIVAKLIYNNTSILFTGDIEAEAEKELVKKYGHKLKSDILKVSHHGSKTSSTQDFIDKVNPKIALIGVGYKNKFDHPSYTTIKTLEKRKIKIYRTDLMGEINIKIKNSKIMCK